MTAIDSTALSDWILDRIKSGPATGEQLRVDAIRYLKATSGQLGAALLELEAAGKIETCLMPSGRPSVRRKRQEPESEPMKAAATPLEPCVGTLLEYEPDPWLPRLEAVLGRLEHELGEREWMPRLYAALGNLAQLGLAALRPTTSC